MAHFAKVIDGKVVQVLVADQEFIDNYNDGKPGKWVKTSYNTHCGKHICPKTKKENTKQPLRKNFAGIGFTYDETRDAFIPPRPYDSWILDKEKCIYEAPQLMPQDGKTYRWDEKEYNINGNGWIEIIHE